MKLLEDYFKIKKEIHEYFGYQEDWVTIPLDDSTEYYWELCQNKDGSGEVRFDEAPFEEGEGQYVHEIYTQRFLKKWVYPKEDYTLICVDTGVDGNKYLSVFDNKKRINR